MKISIRNFLAAAVLIVSQVAEAQFYAGIQTGLTDMRSNVAEADTRTGFSIALKTGYMQLLSRDLGIGTGLELAQYTQDVVGISSSTSYSSYEVDSSTSAFLYTVTADNYKEKQILQALQIPVFLQYKRKLKGKTEFNIRAGIKYFIPLKYKFNASADQVKTTGYYEDVNLFIDDLPEYGFGTQNNYASSGEYKTKSALMGTLETGVTFYAHSKNSIYIALYLENSWRSILNQQKDQPYIGYNPDSIQDRKANGLYSVSKNAQVKPLTFGLSFAWSYK